MNNPRWRFSYPIWRCGFLALSLLSCLVGCGGDPRQESAPAEESSESKPESEPVSAPAAPQQPQDGNSAADRASETPTDSPPAACRRWPLPDRDAAVHAKLTVDELKHEYLRSRQETDALYAGKLLELSGPIAEMGKNMGGEFVVRLGSDERFQVACELQSLQNGSQVAMGRECRIRGVYAASIVPVLIWSEIVNADEQQPTDAPPRRRGGLEADLANPQVTLTAEEYDSEMEGDRNGTTRKYAGKIVQITGRLSRIAHVVSGEIVYRLEGQPSSGFLGVQCYIRAGSPWSCVLPGQTVTLIGEGFRGYPCLVNCDVISTQGLANPKFTAKSLALNVEADPAEFKSRFYLQQFQVTGEIAEKTSPEEFGDDFEITLQATPATRVVCRMDFEEFMASESAHVGDTVTILGWNTKETPQDALILAECLFWRGD